MVMSAPESDHQPHGRCRSCGYPVHRYDFGWQHVGCGMFSCDFLNPEPTCCVSHGEPHGCPDGGTCHHRCIAGACFRVTHCAPLSNVFDGDDWPAEVEAAFPERGYVS